MSPAKAIVAVFVGVVCGISIFTAAAGLTGSLPAALAISAAITTVIALGLRRRLAALDEQAAGRGLLVLSGVASVLAILQLVRLTVFTVAPTRDDFAAVPWSSFSRHHYCATAYFVAGGVAREVTNVYDNALYDHPDSVATAQRKPRTIGGFNVDVYEYPPPFLLLPRVLMQVAPDLTRFRMVWFGLSSASLLLAMLITAAALPRAAATRAVLLMPLVWAGLPTIGGLQMGNFQVMTLAISMAGMAMFSRRHDAAGGALLGFAVVGKLFPGMLLLYLAARRAWRPVLATGIGGLLIVLLALWDMGLAPFAEFVHHLPRLLGGEAFAAFRNPAAVANNVSVPGLVFKLRFFGFPDVGFGGAKLVGWIYTALAVAVTILLARRGRGGPVAWITVLVLATLRSPFLPVTYAAITPLWLLTLLGAENVVRGRALAWIGLAWLAFELVWPVDWPLDPRVASAINLLPMATMLALVVIAVRSDTGPTGLRAATDSLAPTPATG
jgi:alpha-1,2-mannosyltransferase